MPKKKTATKTAKKAKPKKKASRRPKPRQTQVPGTERANHPDITKAAEAYVQVRDERMELTKQEVDLNAKLVAVMRKHKLDTYVDEEAELRVTIPEKDVKAKVAKLKKAADDGD